MYTMFHFAVVETPKHIRKYSPAWKMTLFEFEKDALEHARLALYNCETVKVLSLENRTFSGRELWVGKTKKRLVKVKQG